MIYNMLIDLLQAFPGVIFVGLWSSWQDFNSHSVLHSLSKIAEINIFCCCWNGVAWITNVFVSLFWYYWTVSLELSAYYITWQRHLTCTV